jgi:hypothetical protein
MSKWALRALAALLAGGYIFVYATGRANPPIRSDGYSYYVYLPSWFIYRDATLSAVANDCCGGEFPYFTAIIRWPGTKRWVDAHPIGVAVLQSPFFLAAHGLTKWTNLTPDGFSFYYQHGAGLAGVFWTIAGLAVLRLLLRRRFTDRVTTATLIALAFGTSLYHYGTYDSSYSHAYSFFLVAAFLYLTELWHGAADGNRIAEVSWRHSPWTTSVLLGLVAGLIVLTRHTNVILLLVFPLFGISDRESARAGMSSLVTRWRELAVCAIVAAAVVFPQLDLYYRATGRMFVSSYGDLSFNFLSPHLWDVLFSVRKGLFFWSPLLLAAIAGFWLADDVIRPYVLPAAVVLSLDTYLIASWWDWQFGASYGHRGFVDTLPVLALGLAGFFAWSATRPAIARVVAVVAVLAVGLSVFQMLQYWNGVMPMADLTWDQYRSVFLRWR